MHDALGCDLDPLGNRKFTAAHVEGLSLSQIAERMDSLDAEYADALLPKPTRPDANVLKLYYAREIANVFNGDAVRAATVAKLLPPHDAGPGHVAFTIHLLRHLAVDSVQLSDGAGEIDGLAEIAIYLRVSSALFEEIGLHRSVTHGFLTLDLGDGPFHPLLTYAAFHGSDGTASTREDAVQAAVSDVHHAANATDVLFNTLPALTLCQTLTKGVPRNQAKKVRDRFIRDERSKFAELLPTIAFPSGPELGTRRTPEVSRNLEKAREALNSGYRKADVEKALAMDLRNPWPPRQAILAEWKKQTYEWNEDLEKRRLAIRQQLKAL